MHNKLKGATSSAVSDYWLKFYCEHGCTLCGNAGVLDTSDATTPNGFKVGRRNYCICPNGQAMRSASFPLDGPISAEETTTKQEDINQHS